MADDLPPIEHAPIHPIVKLGEQTRFGAERGPDPSAAGANKKDSNYHSIRQSVRRIAAAEFQIGEKMDAETLSRKIGRPGYLTGAQMIAAAKVSKAMKGDSKVLAQVTEDVDGKLIERVVEAKVTLADLINESYREPDAEPEASSQPNSTLA